MLVLLEKCQTVADRTLLHSRTSYRTILSNTLTPQDDKGTNQDDVPEPDVPEIDRNNNASQDKLAS